MRTLIALLCAAPVAAATYTTDPDAGNNKFDAVFDAPLGERITAVSSQVGCTFEIQGAAGSGRCTVPLASVTVDSEPIKTEHFQQWATNKKSEPGACRFEVKITDLKAEGPLAAAPVKFTALGEFTICGRPRDDKGREKIEGSAVLLPPGVKGPVDTLKIRARIQGFNRERYGVSPRNTEGWLARVQSLANVVAAEGTIDVSLFAKLQK